MSLKAEERVRNHESGSKMPIPRTTRLTDRGLLPELDHLAQTDASGRELGIVPDGVHQAVRRPPRHDGRESWCDVLLPGAAETNPTEERRRML